MSILSKLFAKGKEHAVHKLASIINIRLTNLDSLFDSYESTFIMPIYKDCLGVIEESTAKFGGVFGDKIGNLIWLAFNGENHVENAVVCAQGIIHRISELNNIFSEVGSTGFKLSVGIHTGEILISRDSSGSHAGVNLLGEHVTVATDITSEWENDENEILVSENTVELARDKNKFSFYKQMPVNSPRIFPNQNTLNLYKLKQSLH